MQVTTASLQARLLGVLWLALALSKALSPTEFAGYLGRTLGVSLSGATWLAWLVVFGEAALGVLALRLRSATVLAKGALIASLVISVGLVTYVLSVQQAGGCGCFGSVAEATRSARAIVGGALVFLSAGALQSLSPSPTRPPEAHTSHPRAEEEGP